MGILGKGSSAGGPRGPLAGFRSDLAGILAVLAVLVAAASCRTPRGTLDAAEPEGAGGRTGLTGTDGAGGPARVESPFSYARPEDCSLVATNPVAAGEVPAAPAAPRASVAACEPAAGAAGTVAQDAMDRDGLTPSPVPVAPVPAGARVPATVPVPAAVRVPATVPAPARVPVTIGMSGLPLGGALRLLAAAGGENLYVPSGLGQPVTMSLDNVTIESAVATLLEAHDQMMDASTGMERVVPKATNMVSRSFKLHSVQVASLKQSLDTMITDEGAVTVDPESNTVFLTDLPYSVESVAKFLDDVDEEKEQILIEVEMYEVGYEHNLERGIDSEVSISADDTVGRLIWSLINPQSTTPAFSWESTKPEVIRAALQALRTDLKINLLSNPSVATLSTVPAKVEVVEEVPFIEQTTTTTVGGTTGGAASTAQQVSYKEAGVKLNVTPYSLGGGMLRMTIVPELSEVKSFFTSQQIPIITTRTVEAEVVVHSGDTVILGGMLKDDEKDTIRKIPILGSIPGLGYFFSGRTRILVKREFLVLLTPHVMSARGTAERGREERGALSESDRRYRADVKGVFNPRYREP